MKSRKNSTLALLLGLALLAFTAVAQTPTQGEQKKAAEACCAMESCCCNGDSCPTMKKDGAMTAESSDKAKHDCCGDSCSLKKTDMNHATDDHECCSCCGDSCDMNMKHDAEMKHDATMKHDMKGKSADCCKIKPKNEKTKTKKAA